MISPETPDGRRLAPRSSSSTPPATSSTRGAPNATQAIHGCFVDYQDNIWIAGNGDGIVAEVDPRRLDAAAADRHARQVRLPAGEYLRQLGRPIPAANQSKTLLNEPANVWVDPDPIR